MGITAFYFHNQDAHHWPGGDQHEDHKVEYKHNHAQPAAVRTNELWSLFYFSCFYFKVSLPKCDAWLNMDCGGMSWPLASCMFYCIPKPTLFLVSLENCAPIHLYVAAHFVYIKKSPIGSGNLQ